MYKEIVVVQCHNETVHTYYSKKYVAETYKVTDFFIKHNKSHNVGSTFKLVTFLRYYFLCGSLNLNSKFNWMQLYLYLE